ncbi:ribonuclease HII [Calditerrivibrio sp.]|uniref:ribonuclease HII n=1 Tax=Calditerrivibrio sp. TaxID=2792612 RepID=UPI003D14DB41
MRILGVDEVGRGCFAGPVVAVAIVLKDGFYDKRIIDSKKLAENKRVVLAELIKENMLDCGIGVVCAGLIDKLNILRATKQAMQMAISRIRVGYDRVVIDAVKLNNLNTPYEAHIKAEDKFMEVAAASIVAKVYRDNLMKDMHYLFPQYNWYKNKGYGTPDHIEAIRKFGITSLHRKTFLKGIK